jgi:hypothetical protein
MNLLGLLRGTPLALFIRELATVRIRMQSQVVALLVPEGSRSATLLVRRGNGQFVLEGIDARVASATRIAAGWFRQGPAIVDPATSKIVGYEAADVSAA